MPEHSHRLAAPTSATRHVSLATARVSVGLSLLTAAALAACLDTEGGGRKGERRATGPLSVQSAERARVTVVGQDSLSDSANVVALFPEADGDAIAFTFADPVRRVRSALAITQRKRPRAELIWPDSVTAVWWPADHDLAFATTTGTGVRAIIDIHAESISVVARRDSIRTLAPPDPALLTRARERATAFIDSLHVQPQGTPQRSPLRYVVTRVVGAPGDDAPAAFHVVATDSAGRRTNPAWYVLRGGSGAVALVAEVVGHERELSSLAGAWTSAGTFIYAKQLVLYEATLGG